ncbi:hypothetical protein SDC9_85089 [bioreactor metagenome]|uniref:Uncharacterized protein n=1 Tax=bioreactor metagenome TaxID=1076179 RepID=A0A644ZC40_9ZZZZ
MPAARETVPIACNIIADRGDTPKACDYNSFHNTLLHAHAAVNPDHLAGDIGSLVGG